VQRFEDNSSIVGSKVRKASTESMRELAIIDNMNNLMADILERSCEEELFEINRSAFEHLNDRIPPQEKGRLPETKREPRAEYHRDCFVSVELIDSQKRENKFWPN
jgi:hypothetical protein